MTRRWREIRCVISHRTTCKLKHNTEQIQINPRQIKTFNSIPNEMCFMMKIGFRHLCLSKDNSFVPLQLLLPISSLSISNISSPSTFAPNTLFQSHLRDYLFFLPFMICHLSNHVLQFSTSVYLMIAVSYICSIFHQHHHLIFVFHSFAYLLLANYSPHKKLLCETLLYSLRGIPSFKWLLAVLCL